MSSSDRVDSAEKMISAPAHRIFAALIERSAVAHWLPPAGATAEIEAFDARPGGPFRMTLHFSGNVTGKSAKSSDVVNGHFVRVEPDRLVDQAIQFESEDPAFSGTMRMLWSLEPAGNTATKVRVEAHNVPRGIDPADHAKGLKSSLDNLAKWCNSRAIDWRRSD